MVFKKIIFQNSLMANETPSRPPPFMGNAILNFHFDFLHPSLSDDWKTLKKISGSVVESCSHSGWFTVLRLPVPICPGYQFPWSLSVSLLLIVCFCFCCFLCYLLSLRCVSVLTFVCGGALATYSRFTMIVTSEEESDRGDKKSSREWKKKSK